VGEENRQKERSGTGGGEGVGEGHKTVLHIDKNQDEEPCSSCKRVMNRGGMRQYVFRETRIKPPGYFAVS